MTAPASEGVRLWRVVSTWSGNVSFHTDEATARQYGYHAPYVAIPLDGAERARAERDALEKENARLREALIECAVPIEALAATECDALGCALSPSMKEAVIAAALASRRALLPRTALALGDDGRGRGGA